MMTKRRLSDVLDECLTLLTEDHASVEACLARYPEHAAELRPLIEVAMEMRELPRPEARQAAVDAGRERMLAAVRENHQGCVAEAEQRDPIGLVAWAQDWAVGLLDGLRRPALGWQAALATAAVLLVVAISGGLLLPAWLGARVARTARLDVVQDQVEVWSAEDGAWAPASPQRRLGPGDRVRTNGAGVALLTFFDGSTTALEGETELAVVELSSRRDGTAKAIVLQQESGQTHHEVRPLRRAEARFRVRTPTAVTAVRGTAFDVVVEADGATQVAVWRGLVEVQSLTELSSPSETVELQPGWFTRVGRDRPPSSPVAVPTPLSSERFARLPTTQPTETATPTATETTIPTDVPTATPTVTPQPTGTPEPTLVPGGSQGEGADAPTETPLPTATPQPTDTPLPTETPTATAVQPPEPPTATPTATAVQPPEPPTATPTSTPTPTATPPQPPEPEPTDEP